jgi:hypothetical protein
MFAVMNFSYERLMKLIVIRFLTLVTLSHGNLDTVNDYIKKDCVTRLESSESGIVLKDLVRTGDT